MTMLWSVYCSDIVTRPRQDFSGGFCCCVSLSLYLYHSLSLSLTLSFFWCFCLFFLFSLSLSVVSPFHDQREREVHLQHQHQFPLKLSAKKITNTNDFASVFQMEGKFRRMSVRPENIVEIIASTCCFAPPSVRNFQGHF